MQATRLNTIRRRVAVPEKMLKDLCVVQSKAWKVMVDLVRNSFRNANVFATPGWMLRVVASVCEATDHDA